jgi:hypothetical protein
MLNLYKKGESMTYDQTIQFYTKLADKYSSCFLMEMGQSDYGKPIYLFYIDSKGRDPRDVDFSNETTILINPPF